MIKTINVTLRSILVIHFKFKFRVTTLARFLSSIEKETKQKKNDLAIFENG